MCSFAVMGNVRAYIDGFNFYNGLKEHRWRQFYWLDVVSFIDKFVKKRDTLDRVKYFSAIPYLNRGKQNRQKKFFDANKDNHLFELILGQYQLKDRTCSHCRQTRKYPEEKKTDVNIASHMLLDALQGNVDTMFVLSADSDLTGTIEMIRRECPHVRITVMFPPSRHSYHLGNAAHRVIELHRNFLSFRDSVFSETVTLKNGSDVVRPQSWPAR